MNLDEHTQVVLDNTGEPGQGHVPDRVLDDDGDEPYGRKLVVVEMKKSDCSKYHYVNYKDG